MIHSSTTSDPRDAENRSSPYQRCRDKTCTCTACLRSGCWCGPACPAGAVCGVSSTGTSTASSWRLGRREGWQQRLGCPAQRHAVANAPTLPAQTVPATSWGLATTATGGGTTDDSSVDGNLSSARTLDGHTQAQARARRQDHKNTGTPHTRMHTRTHPYTPIATQNTPM